MQEKQILQILKRIPLFQKSDEELLQNMLKSPGCSLIRISSGKEIGTAGTRELIVLLNGRAQIRSTDGERNVILRTPGAGEVLGAASLFLRECTPLSVVTALGNCTALLIDAPTVYRLLREDEQFLAEYLAFLAGRVQFLNQKIRCFTAGSAERRLALYLATLGEDSLSLPVSFSALAETLDIGRASLYRALDKLEADGLIRREGRNISLISAKRLLQIYQ